MSDFNFQLEQKSKAVNDRSSAALLRQVLQVGSLTSRMIGQLTAYSVLLTAVAASQTAASASILSKEVSNTTHTFERFSHQELTLHGFVDNLSVAKTAMSSTPFNSEMLTSKSSAMLSNADAALATVEQSAGQILLLDVNIARIANGISPRGEDLESDKHNSAAPSPALEFAIALADLQPESESRVVDSANDPGQAYGNGLLQADAGDGVEAKPNWLMSAIAWLILGGWALIGIGVGYTVLAKKSAVARR